MKTWEYPSVRYINEILIDKENGLLTFIGQLNPYEEMDRITTSWEDFVF
ncbi:hypothetical protein [Heyndrickxia vini]|uniref:Uncharacterized protein n=1 Tax=Heyndrickxia vini TaxID=1476025 RepID=A0ABX7E2R4_9BACI|nr:hypothetical protein [Heyndrickxia vini]QQZ10008.1 hypothetical protein I5776_03300 [Heyndrickxia vini]